MRAALDTNRLTDLFRGDAVLAELLATCEQVWIPLFVLGRSRLGSTEAPTGMRLCCKSCLPSRTVGVLLPGRETAEQYARLFVQLKRAGTPIPDNDLWIAALALEHDLLLITRDRHFERIPQLLRGSRR